MNAQYITPAVVFFNEQGGLDREANEELFDHLIRGGVSGIAVMGSSGEFFSMPMEQRKELTKLACGYINGRVKTLVGIGCMTKEDTLELGRYALSCKADGVMLVGPYYINLSEESIEEYFSSVAGELDGDVYLYNYPDRTGYDINVEMTLRLLRRHPNIVGYKDTLPHMFHTRELIKATTLGEFPGFQVFSGYDDNFAHNVIDGGAGAISALSNLVPEVCAKWVRAFQAGDLETVAGIQRYVDRLMDVYSITTPFMPIVKYGLKLRGLEAPPWCIGPLQLPDEGQKKRLEKLMRDLDIKAIEGGL